MIRFLIFIIFLISLILSNIETKIAFIDVFDQLSFQIFLFGLFFTVFSFVLKKLWLTLIYGLISILLFVQILYSCENCLHQSNEIINNSKQINIMTLNAGYSSTSNELDNIIEIILKEKIDILFLQEVSPNFQKKLKNLNKFFPYDIGLNKSIKFWDSVILSRFPLVDSENIFTNATQGSFLFNSKKIILVGVHLYPPIEQGKFNLTIEQMNYWKEYFKKSNDDFFFVGDLNMTQVSKRFKNFLKEGNLFTYTSILKPSFTWPSSLPGFLGIQIDHVLFSKNFKMINKKVVDNFDSDHRALLTSIVLEIKN